VFTLAPGKISRDRPVHPCPGWSRPPIVRNTRRSSLSPPPSPCSFTAVATLSTTPRSSSRARTVRRPPARAPPARIAELRPGHPDSEHPTRTRREHPTDIRRAVPVRPARRLLGQNPARPQIRIQWRLPRLDVSALAARRAVQIAGHLSAHNSETVSSRDVTIISCQLSVR
jgi:hypothetical protein